MARRSRKSLASVWGGALQRSFRRNLTAMTRAAVRAGARAAVKATKVATKSNRAAAKKPLKAARAAAPTPARKPRAAPSGVGAGAGAGAGAGVGAGAAGGRWLNGTAVGPSGARRYRLFIPTAPRGIAPRPVLVLLHGCDQNAAGFARSTRMQALAAREGFLLLCPEQERLANANGCWNWFETRSGRAQAEAASIVAAIGQVCTLHGGDAARVAVAGLSAGASMAALIAVRHPAQVQAVAMHSGVGPGAARSTATAIAAMQGRRAPAALRGASEPAGAGAGAGAGALPLPPLLVIQGLADPIVNARNGRAAAQRWAEAAGAEAGASRTVQRGERRAATLTDFKCRGRLVATLCEVAGLGHAWSGGLASLPYGDPKGPDASRMVWAFALQQFRLLAKVGPFAQARQ